MQIPIVAHAASQVNILGFGYRREKKLSSARSARCNAFMTLLQIEKEKRKTKMNMRMNIKIKKKKKWSVE